MKEDKKTRKKEEPKLDMETTIADMNVEGFSWYNPAKKADAKSGNKDRVVLTKEEKRAIRRAALQNHAGFSDVQHFSNLMAKKVLADLKSGRRKISTPQDVAANEAALRALIKKNMPDYTRLVTNAKER